MTLSQAPFIVIFAPLAAFLLLGAIAPLRRSGKAAAGLVILATAFSFEATVELLVHVLRGGRDLELSYRWIRVAGEPLAEVGLLVDGTSAPMAAVVGLVALCVQIYSLGYLGPEEHTKADIGRYYTWHALFVVAMQSLVLAPNLLQLFIGWELVGLCSYLLIGFYWERAYAGKAAVKAFWVNKFADSFLMLGLVVLWVDTQSFGWDLAGLPAFNVTTVGLLLLMGTVAKSAQVPLHIWLPDAMAGPTPVSALLHAATMVAAGVYLVLRGWPIFGGSEVTLTAMAWIGSITAITAAIFACLQDDLKKLLAYSTCSQLGYMVAALGAGGMAAGYFHLTTHAFFKALLFLGAGSVIHATHQQSMSRMGGLAKGMPVTFVLFAIGSAALVGLPPFAGFFSKELVLAELWHAGLTVPFLLCLLGAAVTGFYVTRALLRVFLLSGEHRMPAHAKGHESPWTMLLPMLALAVLTLGAGFFQADFTATVAAEQAFHFGGVGIAAMALALAGVTAGVLVHRLGALGVTGGTPMIEDRPLDAFYEWAYKARLLDYAAAIAWVDRYVVDGLMNLGAWWTLRAAELARRLQSGRISDYVWAVGMGMLAVMAYGLVYGLGA